MPDIKENTRPIGVFDSGVGGLSVLIELRRLLPNENFVFLADQLYVPYGEKSKEELVDLGIRITDYLVDQHDIKMLVVACNTSTCNSIAELREKYSFPIVGTVPAIKPAAEKTKTKTVAVISTPSTSKSQVLQNLINKNCGNMNVVNIGCKNLENVVEEGKLNSAKVNNLLLKYLKKVKGSDVDCLVLGCTHYPFLKENIKRILGPKVLLIDGGYGIAKQTKFLLEIHFMKNNQKRVGETLYLSTGNPVKFSRVAAELLKHPVSAKTITI